MESLTAQLVSVFEAFVVLLDQSLPPSEVLNTIPVSPTMKPVELFRNLTENKLPVVLRIIFVQFNPAFVDVRTVPYNPTAKPVFSLTKQTDLMLCFVLVEAMRQFDPPFVVLMIVPPSPHAQPVFEFR